MALAEPEEMQLLRLCSQEAVDWVAVAEPAVLRLLMWQVLVKMDQVVALVEV